VLEWRFEILMTVLLLRGRSNGGAHRPSVNVPFCILFLAAIGCSETRTIARMSSAIGLRIVTKE
jgi:hypothetical protein